MVVHLRVIKKKKLYGPLLKFKSPIKFETVRSEIYVCRFMFHIYNKVFLWHFLMGSLIKFIILFI
jgi:hypothetical protein